MDKRYLFTQTKEYKEKMRRIALEKGFGKWMKGRKLSPETKEKMRKIAVERGFGWFQKGKHYSPETEFKKDVPRKFPNLNPSEALAYILGVLYGDGTLQKNINKKGAKNYYIKLNTVSKIFADEFAEAIRKINLHPCCWTGKARGCYSKPNTPLYFVQSNSMLLIEFLEKLTLEKIKDNYLFLPQYKIAFIRGFFDSDGTTGIYDQIQKRKNKIYKYKTYRVKFSNQRKDLLDFVKQLLKDLQLEFNLRRDKKEWVLCKDGKDNYFRFHSLIQSKVKPAQL